MRFRLLAFLLVIALNPLLGDSTHDELIGHWQCSKDTFVSDYVINGDGTFVGSLSYQGKMIWSNAGKWTLSGKLITIELTRSSAEQIPVGTKDRNTIVEITKEKCRLRMQDGNLRTYVRVQ